MGATQVTVTIRNVAEPEGVWEGLFPEDTGATDCLVAQATPGIQGLGRHPKALQRAELL